MRSADASGNESFTVNATFTTLDAVPPVISQLQVVAITTTSATVTWVTNENADSRVDYGLTQAYGLSQSVAAFVTSHSIVLSGLTPNQEYNFRVTTKDVATNATISANGTFRTTIPAAPVISSIAVTNITQTSARVTWTTSSATDSVVQYGTSVPYSSEVSNGVLVMVHGMNLVGLQKGRLYNFRVISQDAYAQFAESTNQTFSTLPDTIPPANVTGI